MVVNRIGRKVVGLVLFFIFVAGLSSFLLYNNQNFYTKFAQKICDYKQDEYDRVDDYCRTQEPTGRTAVGDFDGDGQKDIITQYKSKKDGKYIALIWFGGESQPMSLFDFQYHREDLDTYPQMAQLTQENMIKFDREYVRNEFLKYNFTEVYDDRASSGVCYMVIDKNSFRNPWGFILDIKTNWSFIEEYPCENAGGVSLLVFNKLLKKAIIYHSSNFGM